MKKFSNKYGSNNALRTMANGKALVPENIPIELIKFRPTILIDLVAIIFNKFIQ